MARRYKVKEVARMSGATVRALHHYDAIGLLCPKERSGKGYRLYSEDDLGRLQQIVVYRALGLPLEKIKRVLSDSTLDRRAVLLEQRRELSERAQHTRAMVASIDRTLRSLEGQETMQPEEMFDGFDPALYEAEVDGRWGDTQAFAESSRRTKAYSAEDWARINAENDALMQKLAAALAGGIGPTDKAAAALAEQHRLHIDRYYYPCDHRTHQGLAQMYTGDARFEATFERYGEGVAAYLAAAIAANAERA